MASHIELDEHRTVDSSARPSLTEQAYRLIEERIVTLQFEPGQVLSEASLTSDLAIGRTPIREALQRLAREGLVNILPRRGILVSDINVRNQLELLLVRREVERLMSRLCALRTSREEKAAFLKLASEMEETARIEDDVEFMRLDRRMNTMIARSCRNDYARSTMGLMHGLSRRFWYLHYREVLDLPLCARMHAAVARAIGNGDPNAAVTASDALIDYIEQFTRATLDTGRFDSR